MFYEEHTQHGNAHRNLTVFSAFPLSAPLSHPCLRSHNWALLLLSLPVVPDSSLFRHCFAVSGRSKEERHNFPWISSSLYFCFQFTRRSFSLLSPHLSRCVSFLATVSLFSVTWVKNDPTVCWDESSHCSSGQPWPWLPWTTSVHVCKLALLQRSICFSLVVEAVGLTCLKISSRVRIPLKKRAKSNPLHTCYCSWWGIWEGAGHCSRGGLVYYYPAISSLCLGIWGKPWLFLAFNMLF